MKKMTDEELLKTDINTLLNARYKNAKPVENVTFINQQAELMAKTALIKEEPIWSRLLMIILSPFYLTASGLAIGVMMSLTESFNLVKRAKRKVLK